MKRVLLISSSGGHWIQMNRLLGAFDREDIHYACTDAGQAPLLPPGRFFAIPDASRQSGVLHILRQAICIFRLLVSVRPHVVLTTGAAPGFFALLFAKRLGMRTIWVDSIANVDAISLSGRLARGYADLFLTQWPELAREGEVQYRGAVV